jgi:hypothetical protein
MITQDRLKELLHYDLDTGIFTWKKPRPKINVGDVAGFLNKKSKYYYIGLDLKNYKLHRLAWLYVYGELPKTIDHIDGNPSNNLISNLRSCTMQQNMCNQKLRTDNKSGVKGVMLHKSEKWRVRITTNKIVKHIGYFNDFFEACCASFSNRNKLHGEYSRHF